MLDLLAAEHEDIFVHPSSPVSSINMDCIQHASAGHW